MYDIFIRKVFNLFLFHLKRATIEKSALEYISLSFNKNINLSYQS